MGCSPSKIENEALLILPLSDYAHQQFLVSDHSSSFATDSSSSAVIPQSIPDNLPPPPPPPYPSPPEINRSFRHSSVILLPPPPPPPLPTPLLPLQRAVAMSETNRRSDPQYANGLNRTIIEEYENSDDDDDYERLDSDNVQMVSRLRLWRESLRVTYRF